MAFSPENLKIWVNSRDIHAFIQTATYPPFTKGTKVVIWTHACMRLVLPADHYSTADVV